MGKFFNSFHGLPIIKSDKHTLSCCLGGKEPGKNTYHLTKALPSLARLTVVSASTLFLCLGPAIYRPRKLDLEREEGE